MLVSGVRSSCDTVAMKSVLAASSARSLVSSSCSLRCDRSTSADLARHSVRTRAIARASATPATMPPVSNPATNAEPRAAAPRTEGSVLPITRGCGVVQAAPDGVRETATYNPGMRPLRGRRQSPPGPRLAPTRSAGQTLGPSPAQQRLDPGDEL